MILIIKHVEIEGPGLIGAFLLEKGFDIKVIELEKGERLFPNLEGIEAVIILGGPMNVYQEKEYPFLKEEDEFIRKLIDKGIPTLGICLGAQLIAKALGAKVEKAPQKEIGWYKVSLTPGGLKDPLFSGIEEEFFVFQWHEDQFQLPERAVLIATSQICKNQAFRYSQNIYGFQFHIEVTSEMIEEWFRVYKEDEDLREIDLEQILDFASENKDRIHSLAEKVVSNFVRLI
jgi:GMP synthase-like glutamine amidotransferase